MPRPKKYALIWWLDSAYKDVVNLSVLPRTSREVNSIASVKWHDNKRKATTNARAKVLAISGKYCYKIISNSFYYEDSNRIFFIISGKQ